LTFECHQVEAPFRASRFAHMLDKTPLFENLDSLEIVVVVLQVVETDLRPVLHRRQSSPINSRKNSRHLIAAEMMMVLQCYYTIRSLLLQLVHPWLLYFCILRSLRTSRSILIFQRLHPVCHFLPHLFNRGRIIECQLSWCDWNSLFLRRPLYEAEIYCVRQNRCVGHCCCICVSIFPELQVRIQLQRIDRNRKRRRKSSLRQNRFSHPVGFE